LGEGEGEVSGNGLGTLSDQFPARRIMVDDCADIGPVSSAHAGAAAPGSVRARACATRANAKRRAAGEHAAAICAPGRAITAIGINRAMSCQRRHL
jgi:hypothetical protein